MKYVKLIRSSSYRDAYTTLRAAQALVEAGHATGYEPVTLKRIRAERLWHYTEECVFRHLAEKTLQREFDGKRFNVEVIDWSGTEGLVNIPGLGLRTIYACNIKGAKTWYPETACVYYAVGQRVDVVLKVFEGGVVFVCGLTEGTLDEDHWNRIKDKKLAFRCDEQGRAITGLFS
jgi:hypothetical protein